MKHEDLPALGTWLISGDTGISSETMAGIALGGTTVPGKWRSEGDAPYDPSDFGRCYRLVKAVPSIRDDFDAIASGQADEATLWQWAGGVLTWSRVAELSPGWDDSVRHQARAGLDLVQAVADRWIRTGRAVYTGPELVAARALVELQDAMAEAVDWSEATLDRVRLAAARRREHEAVIEQAEPAQRVAADQAAAAHPAAAHA